MPVVDCAADMVCAVDARTHTAYIPRFLAPYASLIHHVPR